MNRQEQQDPERAGKVVLFKDELWREFRRNLVSYIVYNTLVASVVASLVSGTNSAHCLISRNKAYPTRNYSIWIWDGNRICL